MKVWIVQEVDYDYSDIKGVFIDQAKAEKFLAEMMEGPRPEYGGAFEIVDHEVTE